MFFFCSFIKKIVKSRYTLTIAVLSERYNYRGKYAKIRINNK
ncbi:hypothetical protein FM106_31950 [Brachybacterium faecium]|nr:hypothetical protein FM106_31950 [Brachybacterium faecium]